MYTGASWEGPGVGYLSQSGTYRLLFPSWEGPGVGYLSPGAAYPQLETPFLSQFDPPRRSAELST